MNNYRQTSSGVGGTNLSPSANAFLSGLTAGGTSSHTNNNMNNGVNINNSSVNQLGVNYSNNNAYFGGGQGNSASGVAYGNSGQQYYSSTPPNPHLFPTSANTTGGFGHGTPTHPSHGNMMSNVMSPPFMGTQGNSNGLTPYGMSRITNSLAIQGGHMSTKSMGGGSQGASNMLSMLSGGGNALFGSNAGSMMNNQGNLGPSSQSAASHSRNYNQPHQHAKLARFQNPTSQTSNNQTTTGATNSTIGSILDLPHAAEAGEGTSNSTAATEWTALDIGGMAIRNISQALFSGSFSFLTTLYLNHNQITTLPPAISVLENLKVLHLSSNRLKVLPAEIGKLTNLTELLLFDNQLNSLPFEFGLLFKLETLGLDGNPWHDPTFSLLQKDPSGLSVVPFLRDHAPPMHLYPTPPERPWIPLDYDRDSASTLGFTVATFNILCQTYADTGHYGYVPSWAMSWSYRKEAILSELTSFLAADLIALQEMEFGEYEDSFLPTLRDHTYSGTFFPKSRIKTMSDKDQQRSVDGCALFYKLDTFSMVEPPLTLEYAQLAMNHLQLVKSEHLYNRVMIRDNIGVVVVLKYKPLNRNVIILNTHLHWDPEYRDVKLIQGILMIEALVKKRAEYPDAPIILMGDLNSLKNSGVYQYITSGKLFPGHPDFLGLPYDPFAKDGASHVLSLKDVYGPPKETITQSTSQVDILLKSQSLSYTNKSDHFSGIIDYIFYTPHQPSITTGAIGKHINYIPNSPTSTTTNNHGLILTGLLGLLPKDYLDKIIGLPSPHFPSDHLPLMAEFKFSASLKG